MNTKHSLFFKQNENLNDGSSKMPKRIYFFEFCYAVGGGNLFVLRLMEYLIVKENIKGYIRIICYNTN